MDCVLSRCLSGGHANERHMMRKVLLGAVIALIGLFSGILTTSAHAVTPAKNLDECLQEGQVWVSVVTEEGEYLANQCVGTPETGEQALTDAGLELGHDQGMICSIGGHPDPCPATFNGQYWQYYQGGKDKEFAYSQKGANESEPEPGTIEAWCYNKADQESCQPPSVADMTAKGVVAQNQPEGENQGDGQGELANDDAGGSLPMFVIGGVVVVVAAVAVAFFVLRGRSGNGSDDGTVGGR